MKNMNKEKLVFDKEFRQKVCENPRQYAEQLDFEVANDVEIKVVKNTKDIVYLPIGFTAIQNSDMVMINAAGAKEGSAACASSVATLSSAGSCLSTLGTVATAGTIA